MYVAFMCESLSHTAMWTSRQETAAKQLSRHVSMEILTLPANIYGYMLSYMLSYVEQNDIQQMLHSENQKTSI